MATTTTTLEVDIAVGRALSLTSSGKARVDIVSGAFGAGDFSYPVTPAKGELVLGPYGAPVRIRIRPNAGVTVTYNDKLQQVGVFAEVDPVTGVADGILTTRAARQFASVPLIVTGGDQVGDQQTATFVNGSGAVQWFRQDPGTLVITDIAGQTGTTYTRAVADVDKIVAAYATSWKPTAAGRITRPGLPTAPQNVVATAGNAQATITWTAPASTNGGALLNPAYLLTRLPGGQQFTTNVLTYTDTGLTNGTAYTYYVQAINSAGPSPSAASNSVTPASAPLALRAVSDRVYSNQNRSGSAKQIGGYRTIKINSVGNQFELTFANWFTDGSAQGSPTFTELGSGGPAIFRSQVELAGVFYPVMFSGSLTGNAADAANVVGLCDIPITVAGTEVKVHGYQQQTGAGFIVHGGSGGGASSLTFNAGKDLVRVGPGMIDATATGDWANAGGAVANGNAFGPIMVRALTSKPSVVVYGTSIDFGAYGTQNTVLNSGVVGQQLSDAQIGFVNAGVSSDSVRKWLASSTKRVDLAASATTVIFGGPVNDVTSITPVRTAAEIFADMRTQWALFPGKNLIQCTMTPLATNAAGQTPHANIAVWIAVNNLIRTNTDGVKVFDIAEATCPVGQRDSCIWRTTTISNDGVHPNDAGFDLIRASGVVDISKIL